jgi:hypothetical protein
MKDSTMKAIRIFTIILVMFPLVGFAQLKTSISKPNISQTLETQQKDAFTGFLDPARFHISQSLSMSYMSFGGGGAVINTYVNTLDYKFSDDLFLTTNLGIMNMPYSSLPGSDQLNQYEFFGWAELKYFPSENTAIFLRVEKSPAYYYGNPYNRYGSPFGFENSNWSFQR